MAWFLIVFWAALAYLVLPRVPRILTRIYLPDYFFGRARTNDGLLGDPVNMALPGSEGQIHAAMRRAGWTRADDVDLASSRRIILSTLTRRSYDEAPVSPLFIFGRQQDFAYQQEVGGSPGKRHHIRFWHCPPGRALPGGARVDWLAAGTYDRSVGLSLLTPQITHKIEENTDDERDYVLAALKTAVPEADVTVIRDFSTGYHARNGGGDTISTDGDCRWPILRGGPGYRNVHPAQPRRARTCGLPRPRSAACPCFYAASLHLLRPAPCCPARCWPGALPPQQDRTGWCRPLRRSSRCSASASSSWLGVSCGAETWPGWWPCCSARLPSLPRPSAFWAAARPSTSAPTCWAGPWILLIIALSSERSRTYARDHRLLRVGGSRVAAGLA